MNKNPIVLKIKLNNLKNTSETIMSLLEKIILEEFESSSLDFKTIQYKKEKYENFITDIISMANADTKNPKYIVIGVKAFANGSKEFIGISDDFVDEATYQQLTNENIEPEIKLDYIPLILEKVQLGVFYISSCDNPPYMLKKDYGKLKKGDCFIRKGSHQTRTTRKDIDTFYNLRDKNKQKVGDIQIVCKSNNVSISEIKVSNSIILPSSKAEERIRNILLEKESQLSNPYMKGMFTNIDIPIFGGNTYEIRSIKTLKENLKDVKETYREDDLYYFFEKLSYKINFELLNMGQSYLEDSSIEVKIQSAIGLTVATRVFTKPDRRDWMEISRNPRININYENANYPKVTETENYITIFSSMGDLKHLIPSKAFKAPIRLVLTNLYELDRVIFKIKIYGKSLEQPIEKEIELKVL